MKSSYSKSERKVLREKEEIKKECSSFKEFTSISDFTFLPKEEWASLGVDECLRG